MHEFSMPQEYVKRVIARQGRAHTYESFDGRDTALVVVDMQNYFMAEPYQGACAAAQKIVPNINLLAKAIRQVGGKVIWMQNLAPWESEQSWSAQKERHSAEKAKRRWEAMQPEAHGFQLWSELDVHAADLRVIKRRYSPFTRGSSDIEIVLADHGIKNIIVTGVATNACCETTARDAMMLNYPTVMVSDACAAMTSAEHAASMCNFYLYFGDVQATDEVVTRLKNPTD
jgi:ureidoacrylate peracid hydrolase